MGFPFAGPRTEDTVGARSFNQRRKNPRRKCNLSAEFHLASDANHRLGTGG